MRRKSNVVSLTDQQRELLHRITHCGRAPAQRINHARILLKAAAGETDDQIATAVDVSLATVERSRRRFARDGIDAALERKPQPPRLEKRRLDGEGEAKLIMLACSTPPDGHDYWTLDLLADRMVKLSFASELSGDTVARVLKKTRSSRG